MSGRRFFDRALTGTALALVLALGTAPAVEAVEDTSSIEALIPLPEPADVPPPSIADIGGPATGTVSAGRTEETKTDETRAAPEPDRATMAKLAPDAPVTDDGVPVPEPANVP